MKKVNIKILNNSFIKGGLFLTVSNFVIGFLNYVFNVLSGRALGPQEYAEIATLFSYLSVISIPFGIIGLLIIQKIGRSNNQIEFTNNLYGWIIVKIKKFWYLGIPLLLATPFLPNITNLKAETAYSLSLLIILTVVSTFYSSVLTALHMFTAQSIFTTIGAVIKLSGGVTAFFIFADLTVVLIMILLSSSVQLFLTLAYVIKKLNRKVKTNNFKINKRIIDVLKDNQLWYTASVTLVLTLIGNIDIITVKRFFTPEEAGVFSAWSLFGKIILYIFGPLMSLSFIFFSSKKYEAWHRIFFISIFLFLCISGFIFYAGYSLFGREIITLILGKKFLNVLPFMEWASLFGVGYVLMVFMMQYFLSLKSKICLAPLLFLPIYGVILLFFAKSLYQVMLLDIAYTILSALVFLVAFFKDKFLYFLKIFR